MNYECPPPDLVIERVNYYSGTSIVMYARKYADYDRVYNTHLPEATIRHKGNDYFLANAVYNVCSRAKHTADLVRGLPQLPDFADETRMAQYGRECFEKGREEATVKLMENLVKRAVDNFLGWPLPQDFSPDCGISFDGRPADARGYVASWPTGTNLLNAEQAKALFEHCFKEK